MGRKMPSPEIVGSRNFFSSSLPVLFFLPGATAYHFHAWLGPAGADWRAEGGGLTGVLGATLLAAASTATGPALRRTIGSAPVLTPRRADGEGQLLVSEPPRLSRHPNRGTSTIPSLRRAPPTPRIFNPKRPTCHGLSVNRPLPCLRGPKSSLSTPRRRRSACSSSWASPGSRRS